MTDKEKVRAEIERLYNQSLAEENRQAELGLKSAACTSYGKSKVCKELLSFIDSMQKEPESEDYENALNSVAITFLQEQQIVPNFYADIIMKAVKRGAKWQKEQLLAKAVDGDITFDYYGDGDKTYGCIAHDSFCLEDFGLKDRDKVKIIVIKED